MLKSLSILDKIPPNDTNAFVSNIINKYKNWPDNLYLMFVADFASSYVTKKVDGLPI